MFFQTTPKLVLLDRDGVINVDRSDSVKSIEEFVFLPKVSEAIHLLNRASIPVAIVTNQAVVGRGTISEETLGHIHQFMLEELNRGKARVDRIYQCTSADGNHPDRKPNPGMLLKALKDYSVRSEDTVFIGDALRDLQAAAAIGCRRFLVLTGKGRKTLEKDLPDDVQPVTIVEDLFEAINSLLGGNDAGTW